MIYNFKVVSPMLFHLLLLMPSSRLALVSDKLVMLHQSFKSCRAGKPAIVWGYVRALAPLLAICHHWLEGEVCVIVSVPQS